MAEETNQETTGGTPEHGNETPTFETWLEGQDDTVKGLIDGHVAGLRSALESERSQRKELAKALKDATKDLDEGSKAREALEGLSAKLETHEQQVAAYEVLSQAGVTNLRLGWLAAREAGHIGKDGTVNVEQLRGEYPELFRAQPRPNGNAGSGTGPAPIGQSNGVPASGRNMNAYIRAEAGRK